MFTSGGLWGIESDSGDEYIKEVEEQEFYDLKDHLAAFGIDVSGMKFEDAESEEEY